TVSAPQQAQDFSAPYNRDSAKASIEDVLAGEDFDRKESWRYPSVDHDDKEEDRGGGDCLLDLLSEWAWGTMDELPGIAGFLEVLLWSAMLGLIGIVIFRYRRWLLAFLPQHIAQPERRTPVRLFGLDLTRESLPDDVSTAALDLWHNGEQRNALAL